MFVSLPTPASLGAMKKLLNFCLLVVILGFVAGCDSESPTGPEESEGVVIPSETEVLDESSTSKLSSASDDLQTLTFSGDDGQIESVKEGDVIVSKPDDKIPNGMLRKVTSVERSGNTTTFQTTQATLTEAIQQGSFEVQGELTPSDVQAQNARLEGISFGRPAEKAQAQAAQDHFFIEVDNVVLLDNDGDLSTTGDQITADGSIEFAPDYDFSAGIEDFALRQLRFVSNMNTNSELDLEAEYELIQGQREKTLATLYFQPIVIPVSKVPIVLVPRLDVKVGIEGEVSIGLETGFNYQTDLTAGLEYINDGWSPVSDFSQSASHDPLDASTEVEAQLYTGTPLNLLLYGTAGPFVAPRGFLEAEADLAENPWWTLHWGVEADAGVKLDAFGRTIADHEEKGVIGYEGLLADAGGPYNGNEFEDDFDDGDYTSNPSWKVDNDDDIPGEVSVENGALKILRSNVTLNGGRVGIYKNVNIPVNEDTEVEYDVKASYSNVRGGLWGQKS